VIREIERLIRDLDSPSDDTAEEAQASLIKLGRDVVEPLAAAVLAMNRLGKLCAIEVFGELKDPRAGRVLIALLASEFDTVRDWAAGALGELGIDDAIQPLMEAYNATKQRGTPPDWTEPESIRSALTALGARKPVVPPFTASLAMRTRYGFDAWPSIRLADVLEDLATYKQVVAYFQLWRVKDSDDLYWIRGSGYKLDWNLPWDELVVEASQRSRAAATALEPGPDTVATISWLNSSDL
jgi:hypothetical protein